VAFARNAEAQKTFSKLRSSIGGVYAWRAEHGSFTERQRMSLEADFAFKQALALCPYSPEAVYRYVNLLLSQRRVVDARLIAETLVALAPQDNNAKDLLERIAQQEGRSAK
jgi:cytochrome c-type biogenesis protein CcmH/NrfG